jgi:hypothetical protein
LKAKAKNAATPGKHKRHDIIPREFFFQKRDSEDQKDNEGHDLLNDLELEARELAIAETICWHREAVLEQRNRPRRIAFQSGQEWPYFKCPYQAKVMKQFEQISRKMVLMGLLLFGLGSRILYHVSPA